MLRICLYLCLLGAALRAQDPPQISRLSFTASIRARIENWDWFKAPPADSSYTYFASLLRLNLGQSWKNWEWRADGAFPLYLNLPRNSIAPVPQGPLGYGGDYFAANAKGNVGAAQLKQAYVGYRAEGGKLRLHLGRFEFADGSEVDPRDPYLAELKKERVNQRLIARFNYALRSLDGATFTYDRGNSDVTAMGARLVEGSFQLRAFDEIDVSIGYGGFTRYFPGARASSELRFFGVFYDDWRGVAKIQAGGKPIRLITPGAHFINTMHAGPGLVDMVLWGAAQYGRWGVQKHAATEIATEAGYRLLAAMQPSVRAGFFRSSGDSNPNDNRHTTFFQVLSTPRAYARFPAYILMNTEDRFVQLSLTPHRTLTLRPEIHWIRLRSARDSWYDGGGPFQETSFGYFGRPSGGNRKLGLSFDMSAEWTISERATAVFYAGIMRGGAVPAFVFPTAGSHPVAHLLSVEFIRRF
jgi:hypothetical protein